MLSNRQALRLSLAVAAIAAVPHAASASGLLANGLTRQQQADLKHFQYQVSPQPVPAGFTVTKFHADTQGFAIEYRRRSDGAYLRVTGSSSRARATPAPTPKARGLFSQIGGLFHKHTTTSNGIAQQGTAGEEDQGQKTVLVVDNPYTGKYNVTSAGSCLHAVSDPSSAQYRNAVYHMDGCNMSLDVFAHLVKSQRP